MQLVAYGAQDVYLTGNPQITFFKVVYRRHTNFSMESIEQTMNGTVAAGARTTVTISRNGDLVHRMYLAGKLHDTITTANIINGPATDIASVEVEIGGQRIDKHYGHWMETWAELVENKTGQCFGTLFQNMSGMGFGSAPNVAGAVAANDAATTDAIFFNKVNHTSMKITVPLQFWFCRNPGLALPLIALQYHEVKMIFEWGATLTTDNQADYKLWADYIYLDTDERRRFAQVSHEYLIEQLQFQSEGTATSHNLNFNHPVKEIIWTGGFANGQNRAFTTGDTTFRLVLNGHDRFADRPTNYFTRTQVYQHHSGFGGLVENSVAVYSFGLKPEEHQPSGTCNFSRIDNAQLKCGNTTPLNIYAINYNVLRIMSGMGGLAYSN